MSVEKPNHSDPNQQSIIIIVIFNEDANVTKWFTEGSSKQELTSSLTNGNSKRKQATSLKREKTRVTKT